MLARCARCQGTFTTDHYGRQTCPHCGSELVLADPGAPTVPPAPPQPLAEPPVGAPAPAGAPPVWGAPPSPPQPPAGGGAAPLPPSGGGWAPLPPAPPPPPAPDLPAPFAERASRGFFASYFATWKLALLEPQKFFAHVRVDQAGVAVLFAFLSITAGALLQSLYAWAQFSSMRSTMMSIPGVHQDPSVGQLYDWIASHLGAGLVAGYFAGTVAVQLLLLLVTAAVYHLLLMLFKGASRGFNATLTAVGYSYGTYLILAVPFCGSLVAFVWQLVAVVIGLAAIHRITVGKSLAAVLVTLVGGCCCVCCGSGSLVAFFSEALKHAVGAGSSADI